MHHLLRLRQHESGEWLQDKCLRDHLRLHKLPLSAVPERDGLHLQLHLQRGNFRDHLLPIVGPSGSQRWKLDLPIVLFSRNLHRERIGKLMQLKLLSSTWPADNEPGLSSDLFVLILFMFCVEGKLSVHQLMLLRKLYHCKFNSGQGL